MKVAKTKARMHLHTVHVCVLDKTLEVILTAPFNKSSRNCCVIIWQLRSDASHKSGKVKLCIVRYK